MTHARSLVKSAALATAVLAAVAGLAACGAGAQKPADKPKRVTFVERMCGDPQPASVDGCRVSDGANAERTARELDRLTAEIARANTGSNGKLHSTCVSPEQAGLFNCSGVFIKGATTGGVSSFYAGVDTDNRVHAPIDATQYLLGQFAYTD